MTSLDCFWRHIEVGEHWYWRYEAHTGHGHYRGKRPGRRIWAYFFGGAGDGKVWNACEAPGCIRPDHLRCGSNGDMVASKLRGAPLEEATFWERVNKNGPVPAHQPELGNCWLWPSTRYGHCRTARGVERAHRYAYRLAFGEIPVGLVVLHKCDNPPCVRPEHLTAGTQQENIADARAKGRFRAPARGQPLTAAHRLALSRAQAGQRKSPESRKKAWATRRARYGPSGNRAPVEE